MEKLFKPALWALLPLLASACTPIVATRGNLLTDTQVSGIVPQTTTRAEVELALGPPTATSSFDANTWYYIGERTAQEGIFAPEVVKRRIVRLRFSPEDNNTVASVDDLDPRSGKDVSPVNATTPAAGKEYNFLQEMIGNVGKYNPGTK